MLTGSCWRTFLAGTFLPGTVNDATARVCTGIERFCTDLGLDPSDKRVGLKTLHVSAAHKRMLVQRHQMPCVHGSGTCS